MLPFPYEASVARTLHVLAALVLSTLVGGLALGRLNEERTCRLPRWLRIGLSGALLVSALIHLLWGAWETQARLYAIFIFLGMLSGFAGDLIMARLVRVPNRLVFGMAAFGVGHLLYSAAFWGICQWIGAWPGGLVASLVLAVLLVIGAWWRLIRKPGGSRAINLGSLGYAVLIALMVVLALRVASQVTCLTGLGVGALLFLVSDLVLGNWQVRGHAWTSVNDLIWTTYVLGQLLIVSSVAGAVACFG